MSKRTSGRTVASNWLANNPKVLGALWALTLLLAEAAPVLADGGGGGSGP